MHTGDNMNIYFCRWIGTGSESDPYRTTIYDHLAAASLNASGSYDLRRAPNAADGWCVVWLPIVSEAEHEAIIADPMCVYIQRDVLPPAIPDRLSDITDLAGLSSALIDRGVSVRGIGIDTPTLAALLVAFPEMS